MSPAEKKDSQPGAKKGEMGKAKYLPELLAEKDSLDASFTHAMKLLTAEIERVQKGEKVERPEKETFVDLFAQKNLKLKERVLIPTKQYPRFNFVGKILGPQGSTIKRLQEETGAKISVFGKGSMRDKSKEEDMRKSGEQKYAHLSMDLHVFIEVMAPIPECYLRMAHAMDEVKKHLVPDPEEQAQYLERQYLNGREDGGGRGGRGGPRGGRGGPHQDRGGFRGRGVLSGGDRGGPLGRGRPPLNADARGRGGGMPSRGGAPRGGPGRGAMRGGPSRGGPAGAGRGNPNTTPTRGGGAPRSRGPAPGQPRMLPPQALGHQEHRQHHGQHHAPPKPEEYGEYASYEESYAEPAYESYDAYYAQQPQPADTEYYDYGHGEAQETYEPYAQDDWGEGQWSGAGGKAPSARGAKGASREHPYQRY